MTDAFARWRARRRPASAAAPAPDAPIQTYEAAYMNRGWAVLLLVLWIPVPIGGVVLIFLFERALNAISYSTGPRVLALLVLLASIAIVPLLLPSSWRTWTLWADRIEIRQRPVIPLFGPYRRVRIPFAEIAVARLGEALSGMSIFELQTDNGSRYRIAPRHVGRGEGAHLDEQGFDAFVEAIRTAIVASGLPLPPGEELRLPSSGLTGVIVLGAITALLGAGGLAGLLIAFDGEPVGLQLLMFVTPFALLFGGLFLNRLRRWSAARAAG